MNTRFQRSDASGTAVGNFTSVSLSTSNRYATDAADVRDFRNVTWHIYVSNKSTAAKIIARVLWAEKASPALPTTDAALGDYAVQPAEEVDTGVGTELDFSAEFDLTGKTAPFCLVLTLPAQMPKVTLALKADAGTPAITEVRVWRGA